LSDRPAFSARSRRQGQLLGRQGDPGHLRPVVGRQGQGHAAPARADVQHLHARRDVQLGADMGLLGDLGFFQGHVGPREIGAAVLHVGVEEALIELVGHVVVVGDVAARGDAVVDRLHRALEGLLGPGQRRAALGRATAALADDLQQVPQRALLDLQVAFHIGLAEAQAGIGHQAAQAAAVDPHGHRRTRAVAGLHHRPVGQVDGQVADLDHLFQQSFDHGGEPKPSFAPERRRKFSSAFP
jgi:hypothetical protein